jgi:phosphoribosylformylglycinamidine synthase
VIFGSTEYAKCILGDLWGCPDVYLNLSEQAELHKFLVELADKRLIFSASDVDDGGLAVAIAECSFANGIGCDLPLPGSNSESNSLGSARTLFAENGGYVIVTCAPEVSDEVVALARDAGIGLDILGRTMGDRVEIKNRGDVLISATIDELRRLWRGTLESQLAAEVVTA